MWLELLNKIKYAIEKAGFDGQVKLGFLSPQNSGVDSLGMVMLGRGEAMPADENVQESGYQIIDIRCTNKTDDHDSMRPFIGTQYRFEAKMYDLKENLNTKGGIY